MNHPVTGEPGVWMPVAAAERALDAVERLHAAQALVKQHAELITTLQVVAASASDNARSATDQAATLLADNTALRKENSEIRSKESSIWSQWYFWLVAGAVAGAAATIGAALSVGNN